MSLLKVVRNQGSFINRLSSIFLYLLLLAVPLRDALAASEADLIKGAKQEGELLFYSSINVEENDAFIKRFEAKYPFLKVKLVRLADVRLLNRILAEVSAKKHIWDVALTTDTKLEVLKIKGLLAKYVSPHKKFFPEVYKPSAEYWTSAYVNREVLAYNTKLVSAKEVPKTYEDLLNPKWKGKMGMVPNRAEWFADMLKYLGEKKGMEYMRKLSQQNIQWRMGSTLNSQMLAAGEFHIGLFLFNNEIEKMKADGASVEWVALEPIRERHRPIAISAHAPHPNAAKLFVDFILSKEAQEIIAGFFRVPARTDVAAKVPRLKCEGLKFFPFNTDLLEDYQKYEKMFQEVVVRR